MNGLTYSPPPSLKGFFLSDKFVNLVVGPIGSTKTTAGILKIAYEAAKVAPCRDGIRRSRVVWVRQTREQLLDTSIPDFLRWFPEGEAGVFQRTGLRFILRFSDVECEVLFRGLDDSADVRRLLSLQATFAVVDEFREINQDVFVALQGRLGRYPSKADNGVGACDDAGRQVDKLWGMSNPPDSDTWIEELLTNPPANTAVFFQPSGLSPEADWLQYLKAGYYENLAQGKSQDWIDVYIHAKFGRSLSGEPVFGKSFSTDRHVVDGSTLNVISSPVLVGVDAGLSPAAVIAQVDYRGRLIVHDALVGESMGALRFVREKLKPLLANKYAFRQVAVIIDPAAFQRAQTDERSVADVYKAEGFHVVPARTNSVAARIAAVENYLTRMVDGKPAFVINKDSAAQLVHALRSKYRYRINTKGQRDDTPEKSHPWSDVCFLPSTPILTEHGAVPIETLRPGDKVAVHDGLDMVVATSVREVPAGALVRLTLSDGSVLVCTRDHPFAVYDDSAGYVPADMLTTTSELVSKEHGLWASGVNLTLVKWRCVAFALRAARRLKSLLGKPRKVAASIAPQHAVQLVGALEMVLSTTDAADTAAAATTTKRHTSTQYDRPKYTRSKQPLTVVQKDYLSDGALVYNLRTERTSTYYAGPALVHNCDALQYVALHADNGATFGARLVEGRKTIKPANFAYV